MNYIFWLKYFSFHVSSTRQLENVLNNEESPGLILYELSQKASYYVNCLDTDLRAIGIKYVF